MCFREHIFYLFAGINIPFRHFIFSHFFFHIIRESLSFTDRLHDLKGEGRLQPLIDQIDHNVITAAYYFTQSTDAVMDKLLCIAEPYIRPVRQA
ncbi:Uncharacterised protein [Mycobacteroides abscessus subsp. abscessus]|nr:Uncharacterised protein [Mycobacteroides abscessus subsp. abscessus]